MYAHTYLICCLGVRRLFACFGRAVKNKLIGYTFVPVRIGLFVVGVKRDLAGYLDSPATSTWTLVPMVVIALDDEYDIEGDATVAEEPPSPLEEELRERLAVMCDLPVAVRSPTLDADLQCAASSSAEASAPVVPICVATNPILAWFGRAASCCPHHLVPRHWTGVAETLVAQGATHYEDFAGLSPSEAVVVWTPLASLSPEFLNHLWAVLSIMTKTPHPLSLPSPTPPNLAHRVLPFAGTSCTHAVKRGRSSEAGDTVVAQFLCSMQLLREARRLRVPPLPRLFAGCLRTLSRLPENALDRRWQLLAGCSPPELPAARASWLQGLQLNPADLEDVLLDDTLWRCFCSWRRSGLQYAVAVELWGRAAGTCVCAPWPPSATVLGAFASFFRNGLSLRKYLSHVRIAVRLVLGNVGILAETEGLVRGSIKATPPGAHRYRSRASAINTRHLVQHARDVLDRPDLADSWVVARHFCLRYAAEAIPLEGQGDHSEVRLDEGVPLQVTIILKHRKMHSAPVAVVRRCICKLQGRSLCGVCILRRRWCISRIFPLIVYADALGLLKVSAEECGLERAMEWGTHCFRRGWADEALKAGGPCALFYSGGWRGIAAFGYVAAQSRGALAAAEWLVDHSDSSDNGQ